MIITIELPAPYCREAVTVPGTGGRKTVTCMNRIPCKVHPQEPPKKKRGAE